VQTNKVIARDSELGERGQDLLAAAKAYWDEYQRVCDSAAVVWLDDDSGHFVLFTRGEYRSAIMDSATRECRGEVAMFEPFTATDNATRHVSARSDDNVDVIVGGDA